MLYVELETIIMDLKEYISTVNQKYRAGNATEHSYRGALEQLMQTLLPKLRIVNEPKRVKCGAPDYIASRKDGMPVFYIEAKDIGDNIKMYGKSETNGN